MDNNKPIIKVNDTGIIIKDEGKNTKIYYFDIGQGTYKILKKSNFSLEDVALSVLPQLKNSDLLDDEIVLQIIDKILRKIRTSQYAKKLEEKRDEVERQILETKEIIKAPKEQGELEPQENQSKGKTNEDFLNEWINEHNYSKCAKMLRAVEPEKKEQFLRELLKQEDGYEKCIMVLFSLRNYDSADRENLKSELEKMIPEDIRTQISLEELRAKLSSAEDNLIKFLEMSEQEAYSEEIAGDEESDKDDLEEFIANLNLEELVTPNPDPEAIRKGVEIEMHIEYDKDKKNDEEQEEQQQGNEESHQNEHDEDVDIEENADKDDSEEQLQSNVNQLMEELEQLNRQILETDEEIKKCDDIIQYYSIFSALKTIKAQIDEIEDKTMLRNLNDDEEKELEQLKQNRDKLIQKLRLLRSNSSILEFETENDLRKIHTAKVLEKEELDPKFEELKTRRDEMEREIAEIIGTIDEKDKQNSERL